MSDGLAVFC